MSRDSNQSDMMALPQTAEIHPKGLLEAISYIDQQFANEIGGCLTNSLFLTTTQRIEFMEVGFKSSFVSGVISALLTPVAIGAVEQYIPIFGNSNPTWLDLASAFLLAFCFSLGYAAFIARTATQYVGEYTRAMVRNLLGGMFFGAVLKAIMVIVAFYSLYYLVLTDKVILWITSKFYTFKMTAEQVARIYYWLQGFKGIFLTSASVVALSTALFVIIPFCAYYWAYRRNKRLIKAGIIRVENKAF